MKTLFFKYLITNWTLRRLLLRKMMKLSLPAFAAAANVKNLFFRSLKHLHRFAREITLC